MGCCTLLPVERMAGSDTIYSERHGGQIFGAPQDSPRAFLYAAQVYFAMHVSAQKARHFWCEF